MPEKRTGSAMASMRRRIHRPHQLDSVERGAEHQRQHPDPRNLVDERSGPGNKCGDEEQPHHECAGRGGSVGGGGGERPRLARACDVEHDRAQDEVQKAGEDHRARHAEPAEQQERRCQGTGCGADRVGEIEHRQVVAARLGAAPDHCAAHERKRHAEQHGLRDDEHRAQCVLIDFDRRRRAERGYDVIHRGVGEHDEYLVKRQRGEADDRFDPAVGGKQVGDALAHAAGDPGAEGHAAHERGEHEGLRERRGAEKQLQVVGPDGFVDQPRESRQHEQGEQQLDVAVGHVFLGA
jgi:hypothetical protein